MKKKLLPFVTLLMIAAGSLAGGYYESTRSVRLLSPDSDSSTSLTDDFREALAAVQDNYAGDTDIEQLGKDSIEGMLRQLDPHSLFFIKSDFDDIETEQTSRTYGIGVTINKRYDRVYILSVTPGGPSQRAGLRYGDAIIKIDQQNVEDWSKEKLMHRVRGEKGELIEITVDRAGAPSPITVRIRRDEVKLPTVQNAFMVGQTGVGYVGLTGGFSSKTDDEVAEAIGRLKQEGMRQLVLDLRGNPGGLLDEAIKVSKVFLPAGMKIVEVHGRDPQASSRAYQAPDNNMPETMPMVVLINRHSASASEIVAGALQDHDRALIVGERSFGKGLVQGIFHLWGGAGLILTTGKYYTPTGRSIQRDYSNVSIYDYFYNRNSSGPNGAGSQRGDALRTDLGRAVYGGGGIKPDVEVKASESPLHVKVLYGVFDFVRQLVAGQIPAFREYRVTETQYKTKISPDEVNRYPITDQLIAAFHIPERLCNSRARLKARKSRPLRHPWAY